MAVLKILKSEKARPFLIGGVVIVGGIILFMMLRGGGSSSASVSAGAGGPSEALQAAQLQASTQIALGSQAAGVETMRFAGEVQAFMYGKDADVEVAGYARDTALANTAAQQQVAIAGLSAQTQIATMQEATAQYGIGAQRDVQVAGLAAQTYIAEAQYDFLGQQSSNQFAYLTQTDTNRANVDMARINADVVINQQNQKTARRAGDQNFLGGLVGGAVSLFSMFSDERMKKQITWTGQNLTPNPAGRGFTEVGKYDWKWKAGSGGYGPMTHGVLAQEIAIVAPERMGPARRGRMTINYQAM